MNPFLNPFQESNRNESRMSRVSFLPRYARGGDRRQETGEKLEGRIANYRPRVSAALFADGTRQAAMQ